jgi:predicted ATPase/class 3 adenylate cyclase
LLLERFGKYELLTKLGHGGMAEVYLARAVLAEGLQKLLAIKKIHSAFSENPRFLSMFVEEAKIAAELNHPNIVQVFDFGNLGGSFFLAMEYIEGLDLMRLVKLSRRRLPFGIAAYVVQQLAQGLDYAHRKRDPYGQALEIVHRDVSPQNVLISVDGAVKLVDFGIAKARDHQEEEGVVKGKFAYMSPEQACGQKVDHRSDIYSAGIVLYELVAGRTPFGTLKGRQALDEVRRAIIPPPSRFEPRVPKTLEQVILKALESDLDQRFQTAHELQAELVKFLYGQHSESGEIHDAAALSRFLGEAAPDGQRVSAAALARAEGTPRPVTADGRLTPDSLQLELPRGETEVTERKNVVVVAGQFGGLQTLRTSGEGADPAVSFLGSFKTVLEDVAYKLDARLRHFDDLGFSLLVGIPVSSEEDPARAIRLARSLLDAWDAMVRDLPGGVDLRFGLARGLAEVRRGRKLGFEYKLLGAVAETAMFLAQQGSAGWVTAGASVYQGIRKEWNVDTCPSVTVAPTEIRSHTPSGGQEGKELQVYRVTGLKPRHEQRELARSGAIVGRELELRGLADAYRQALMLRRTRLLGIVGEAGVGKRSLVETFIRELEPRPETIIRATGRVWNQNLPYSVMADLCRDIVQVEEWTPPEEVVERARALTLELWPDAPREAAAHSDVFLLLLGAVPPASLQVPADPEHRRRHIGRSLQLVLDRLGRKGPLVLVLEEFHWADFQSRQLVAAFAKNPPPRPILAVVTSRRDDALDQAFVDGVMDPFYVKELGPEDAGRLVLSRFVDPKGAGALARQILAKGGGNPQYLLAILEALVDQGVVAVNANDPERRLDWIQRDAKVSLPPSVEALVGARLDQLPSRDRKVLRTASVLGRSFKKQDVEALSETEVSSELVELESRGLIVGLKDDPDRFEFTKQVILDIAHKGISAADGRRLHKKAAELLAAEPSELVGHAARIAWHYERASMPEESGRQYLEAAMRAKALYAHKEAFHFLGKAQGLLSNDLEALFQISKSREEILRGWGKRDAQLEELRTMETLSEKTRDSAHLAQALNRLMFYYQAVSWPKESVETFDRAWKAASDSGDPEVMAEALWAHARALSELGENTEALQTIQKARSLRPVEEQTSEVWGRTSHYEGNALFYIGDYRKAVASYAKAREIYHRLGLKSQEAIILNNMGFLSLNLGKFEDAEEYLKTSYTIEVELGSRDSLGVKLSNLGQVYNSVGLLDKALKHLLKAEEVCVALKDPSNQADAVVSIGQVYMNKAEIDKAVSELRRGFELAARADNRYDVVRAHIYLAMALVRGGGKSEEAKELAGEATDLSRKARMPQGEVFGMSVQAEALAALGRPEEALGISAQAVARMATCGHVAESEIVMHTHAKLLAAAGREDEAQPYLEKAVQEVQRKKELIKDEAMQRGYLSVPPARDILADYERLFGTGSA